jgi:prepilin peptidase CpaA
MTYNTFVTSTVIAIGLLACVTDVRSRRIPNALTFGAALAGLLVHRLILGTDGALLSASGWLVGLLIFFPFFALGGMGGGDVKLLAALGAWLGPRETLWLAAYSALAGGVMGVVVAFSKGYLRTALSNVFAMLGYWRTVGFKPVPDLTLESASTPRLAYALPIFVGIVVTLWK